MNLEPFTGPGSTPSRRRFWDKITQAVIASQKVAGENVTVAEHQGAGTIININRVRGLEGGVGACCYDDGTCDDLTEADCNDAGGNWQGSDTTCADDPNPCLGACCEGEDGTTCVEDSTPDSCADDGGTFQDFGSTCEDVDCTQGACCNEGDCSILNESDCLDSGGVYQGNGSLCDPDPCALPPCSCGFDAFDDSGRKFLTRMIISSGNTSVPFFPPVNPNTTLDWSSTKVESQDPDTCDISCESCSGSSTFFHQDLPSVPPCTGTGTPVCSGGDACSPSALVNFTGCDWTYDTTCSDNSDAYMCGSLSCTDTTTVSATEQTCHLHVGSDDDFVDADVMIILSDECMPM